MIGTEIDQNRTSMFAKIVALFKKIFGIQDIPPELTTSNQAILDWWEIYRLRPKWLKQRYVTTDGVKRERTRLQLGMGKISCAEMAGLVLAEQPDVSVSPLVKSIIEKERLWDNLKRSLEYQGALGAQVLKVCIGTGVKGSEISLDFVKASSFIPLTWDNTEITEGAFLDRRMIKGKSYVRIETHRLARNDDQSLAGGYEITNKVYEEDSQVEAPLSLFGDNIKDKEIVPIDIPLFAYIKNPEANNLEPESPTGISLFANATDTIYAIDVAFDQFFSDVDLGGRRIALPGSVFRTYVETDPVLGKSRRLSYFDPSDRVFMRLEGDDAEKFEPKDMTFDIRSDQFKAAIQTLLNLFAFQTGFDAGYFTFDGVSVTTATEVISKNSHTYKTMQGYRDGLDRGLKQVFQVINRLGVLYGISGAADAESTIEWDDSVIEDRNSRATYYTNLYNANLIDLESALMKIHGLNEAGAAAMAKKIVETKQKVTNASLFPGEVLGKGKEDSVE